MQAWEKHYKNNISGYNYFSGWTSKKILSIIYLGRCVSEVKKLWVTFIFISYLKVLIDYSYLLHSSNLCQFLRTIASCKQTAHILIYPWGDWLCVGRWGPDASILGLLSPWTCQQCKEQGHVTQTWLLGSHSQESEKFVEKGETLWAPVGICYIQESKWEFELKAFS